jgi:hypothetical protein
VAKPSEVSPLSTLELVRLIDRHVGLPPGVLNLVNGAGEAGAPLVASEVTTSAERVMVQHDLVFGEIYITAPWASRCMQLGRNHTGRAARDEPLRQPGDNGR